MIVNDETKKKTTTWKQKKKKKKEMKRGTRQKSRLNKYIFNNTRFPCRPNRPTKELNAGSSNNINGSCFLLRSPFFYCLPFFYSWFNTCFFVFLYFVLVSS
jgi:hypothetical protein